MSISNSRLAANRQNAQLSTGPVTPSGKQISSRNAAGPIARFLALSGEDPDELDRLIAGYTDAMQPSNAIETDLVHDMAVARWRKNRLLEFEASLLTSTFEKVQSELGDNASRAQVQATALERLLGESKTWNTLQRYIRDAERTFNTCLKQLTESRPRQPKKTVDEDWLRFSKPKPSVPEAPQPNRFGKNVPLRPNGYPVNLALAL